MTICNGKSPDGSPCNNDTLPGNTKCNRCAILFANKNKIARVTSYKLTTWKDRVEELSNDTNITSLGDEVGILRMTLEGILNLCRNSNDLIVHAHRISDLATRIEKLVVSCHKLQKSTGSLLDKGALVQLAGTIIGIIQRHVQDASIIELIANEIITEIANIDCSEALES